MNEKRSYVLLPNAEARINDCSMISFFLFVTFQYILFFLSWSINLHVLFIVLPKHKANFKINFYFVAYKNDISCLFPEYTPVTSARWDKWLCERLNSYCLIGKSCTIGNAIYNFLHAPVCFSTGARSILELLHSYSAKYWEVKEI